MATIIKFEDNIKMLEDLHKEIHRLGIEDNPSRTKYNKMFDKSIAPSAQTVMHRLQLTWPQVMWLLRLEYGGYERAEVTFSEIPKDELVELIVNFVHDNNITSLIDYNKKRDIKTMPEKSFIITNLGGWKNIRKSYKEKYGKDVGR